MRNIFLFVCLSAQLSHAAGEPPKTAPAIPGNATVTEDEKKAHYKRILENMSRTIVHMPESEMHSSDLLRKPEGADLADE